MMGCRKGPCCRVLLLLILGSWVVGPYCCHLLELLGTGGSGIAWERGFCSLLGVLALRWHHQHAYCHGLCCEVSVLTVTGWLGGWIL